jgi:hypothetical protein
VDELNVVHCGLHCVEIQKNLKNNWKVPSGLALEQVNDFASVLDKVPV